MKILLFLLVFQLSFTEVTPYSNEKKYEKDYIARLIYGEGTYSTYGDLLFLQSAQRDEQDSYLIGVQVEKFIARDLFKESTDFTLFLSFLYHSQNIKDPDAGYPEPKTLSGVDSFQLNGGIKVYYKKFPWNKYVRTRLGFGEGLSVVTERLDLEVQNSNKDGTKSDTLLLNYLDLTLSFNLKDITRIKAFEDYYIGTGVAHRSGIFGTINGVNGGSNYWTFFLEGEF